MKPSRLLNSSFTCLPNWLRSKLTPNEGWLLWVLKSHYPNIYPSIETLAHETGICQRTVTATLRKLENRGLIAKANPFQSGNKKRSNSYELFLDEVITTEVLDVETSDQTVRSLAKFTKVARQDMPTELGRICQPSLAKFANKEEQVNKIKLNKKKPKKILVEALTLENPPIRPPKGAALEFSEPCQAEFEPDDSVTETQPVEKFQAPPSAAGSERQVQPLSGQLQALVETTSSTLTPITTEVQSLPAETKTRQRSQPFRPVAESIPPSVAGLAPEILDFWAAKSGKKTDRAWKLLIGSIERIQHESDEDSARYQLELGAARAWQSVDYDRWAQFGRQRRPKPATPVQGTGRPWEQRDLRGADAYHAAIALLRHREASKTPSLVSPCQTGGQTALGGRLGASGDVLLAEVMA